MNKKRIIIALALTATLSLGIILSGCQTGGTTPTTSGTTAASSEKGTDESEDKNGAVLEPVEEKKATENTEKSDSKDASSKDALRDADFSGIVSDLKDGEITAKDLQITEQADGAMMVNMDGEERTIYYDENTVFENVDLGSMSAPKEEFTPTDKSSLTSDAMIYAWGKEVDGKFVADKIVINSRNA